MDGCRPLHDLPGGAGEQERWPVLCAERHLHHPAVDPGVHDHQGTGDQRPDQGAKRPNVRSDCSLKCPVYIVDFQRSASRSSDWTVLRTGLKQQV